MFTVNPHFARLLPSRPLGGLLVAATPLPQRPSFFCARTLLLLDPMEVSPLDLAQLDEPRARLYSCGQLLIALGVWALFGAWSWIAAALAIAAGVCVPSSGRTWMTMREPLRAMTVRTSPPIPHHRGRSRRQLL